LRRSWHESVGIIAAKRTRAFVTSFTTRCDLEHRDRLPNQISLRRWIDRIFSDPPGLKFEGTESWVLSRGWRAEASINVG